MLAKYKVRTLGEEAVTFEFDHHLDSNDTLKSISDSLIAIYPTKLTNLLAIEIRKYIFQKNGKKTTQFDFPDSPDSPDSLDSADSADSADSKASLALTDCINSFTTLTIFYEPEISNLEEVISFFDDTLAKVLSKPSTSKYKAKVCCYNIPACYEIVSDTDLEEVANQLGLSIEKVIELHSKQTYKVDLIGFSPGFPFCTSVDKRLALDRKKIPRIRMQIGDIAIVQDKTVIYPHQSPGGWNVVARTPVKIFDIIDDKPICLKFGDEINFQKISLEQYSNLKTKKLNLTNFHMN